MQKTVYTVQKYWIQVLNEDRGWTPKQFEDAKLEEHLYENGLSRKQMSAKLNVIDLSIY